MSMPFAGVKNMSFEMLGNLCKFLDLLPIVVMKELNTIILGHILGWF